MRPASRASGCIRCRTAVKARTRSIRAPDRLASKNVARRAGDVSQRAAGLRKPPAAVDVVAGAPEWRVEPADRAQALRAKGHVASGQMLRQAIVHEHVGRISRGARNRLGDHAVTGRSNIWSTDAGVLAPRKTVREIHEPMLVRPGVIIELRDDFPVRRVPTG